IQEQAPLDTTTSGTKPWPMMCSVSQQGLGLDSAKHTSTLKATSLRATLQRTGMQEPGKRLGKIANNTALTGSNTTLASASSMTRCSGLETGRMTEERDRLVTPSSADRQPDVTSMQSIKSRISIGRLCVCSLKNAGRIAGLRAWLRHGRGLALKP